MVELTKQMKNQCPQLANRPGHHGPAHTGVLMHSRGEKQRNVTQRRQTFADAVTVWYLRIAIISGIVVFIGIF